MFLILIDSIFFKILFKNVYSIHVQVCEKIKCHDHIDLMTIGLCITELNSNGILFDNVHLHIYINVHE